MTQGVGADALIGTAVYSEPLQPLIFSTGDAHPCRNFHTDGHEHACRDESNTSHVTVPVRESPEVLLSGYVNCSRVAAAE
jgi:hypothetical protein